MKIKNTATNTIFVFLVIISCNNDDSPKEEKSKVQVEGYLNDYHYHFSYDSLELNYNLSYTKNDNIFKYEYFFNQYGNLWLKTGMNFWGEEEKYFFDVNGTLTEYRKLVRINEKKIGVQEFIRYKNGIIDQKKSHYFDFNIIDSVGENYNVKLEYKGAFELDTLSIFVNDFAFQIGDINFKKPSLISKNRIKNISFWVPKNQIYDEQFDFFQINVYAFFINNGGAIQLSPNDESNFPTSQGFILRKFRKNMTSG